MTSCSYQYPASTQDIPEDVLELLKCTAAARHGLTLGIMAHHPPPSSADDIRRCVLCEALSAIVVAMFDFELDHMKLKKKGVTP